MKLVRASHEILAVTPNPLELIELAGRTCYKSETKGDHDAFARRIIKNGHESVIEHATMTVRFICDRGVSHELVRHRLASFGQESTRYCTYRGDLEFIIPHWVKKAGSHRPGEYASTVRAENEWIIACENSEKAYNRLLKDCHVPAQDARGVLPNALKTEIVMTANLREWRHVLKLRTSKAAHPDMRALMLPLLAECKEKFNAVFEGIGE
jgi:thymidylate synthase (FAD)